MRIHCTGVYDAGHFILTGPDGSIYRAIRPDEVFSIGNSVGGYWARPIHYAGRQMLALVRLTGRQKGEQLEQIRREMTRERGEVLRPGPGLWAVSSGAARRGVWHQHRPADALVEAVRALRAPSSAIVSVDTLVGLHVQSGGNLCSHSTHGGAYYGWVSDAAHPNVHVGSVADEVVAPTYIEAHSNQYHIGCQSTAAVEAIRREGTWCIQWREVSSRGWSDLRRELVAVYVTPTADREQVAAHLTNTFGGLP